MLSFKGKHLKVFRPAFPLSENVNSFMFTLSYGQTENTNYFQKIHVLLAKNHIYSHMWHGKRLGSSEHSFSMQEIATV